MTSSTRLLPLLASLLLLCCADAHAQTENWRPLFNGEDLSGWTELNGDHVFEAEDGMIVGSTVPGQPNGFLTTDETFGDFILELEVNVEVLMNNSGIQFRSLSTADYNNYRVHGYQAEIDTKPQRWSGGIYDEARRGWLYIMEMNPEGQAAFVNNAWNHYRIEAIGTSSRIWVNGVPTSHLVDDETLRGFIGLQLHANNPNDPPGSHLIRFRNVRIQTEGLTPSPYDDVHVVNLIPNRVSGQERAQGFGLLFDGNSLVRWSGAVSDWSAAAGELRASGAAGSDLVSDRAFEAFELKFDFRPSTDGATCGIFYLAEADGQAGASQYCRMASQKLEAEEWNRGVIRVHPDGFTEYFLNGYKILAYRRGNVTSGHVRLDHDGGATAYRSIKIRALD